MTREFSYTTEEIAQILRVSKLTVYDLIKKGELPAYRVGRQMRVDATDLDAYKSRAKGEMSTPLIPSEQAVPQATIPSTRPIIISGQDITLDILANSLERQTKAVRPLRSYVGSLNSLIAMYNGEADIVSTHLFDGDTGEYNVPYVRRILLGHRFIIINLVSRWAGFYVSKGNPKQINTWGDLQKPHIRIVNREKGSGARILLEEQLRLHHIPVNQLTGYEIEELNHLGVAGAVSRGDADVGVGIEKVAQMVDVAFIPLIKERYDLVMLKKPENKELLPLILEILNTASFKQELETIGGYDVTLTGKVIYDTH